MWVEVTNNFGEKHIVSVIYRHPRGNVKLFTEHFEKSLSNIENNRSMKHSIITGDLNIDLIKFDLNDTDKKMTSLVYTTILCLPELRIIHAHRLTIFLYLSRKNRTQIASGNLMTDMSDYFANFIILHSNTKSKETDRVMVRIYIEQNKNTFQKLLGDVNWDIELEQKNINEAVMTFNQKITVAYYKSFPFKRLFKKGPKTNHGLLLGLEKL